MDRCLHVTGASLGQDTWLIGKPRGRGAHAVGAPEMEGTGRCHSSTHGPTS
jgi:hypothetical protein